MGSLPSQPAPRVRDLWAGLNPDLYRGRGQTFAKHVLLRQYLRELAFKVLQSPSPPAEFLYLDGFSGPWQAQAETFEDTSFSIALSILTDVRESLASVGKFPTMRAIFVEERKTAFARLSEAVARFPRIKVQPLHGTLEDRVPEIAATLQPNTFLFAFLDPCGWKGMALRRIAPLVAHRPGEVLVNVMMDSIRRHITFEGVAESADDFFGGGDWREQLAEAERRLGDREAAILEVYLGRLKKAGKFEYLGTTRVRDPDKARTYFHLAYATRHHKGMEVFRRSEKRCIEVQERVVAQVARERREREHGTPDLFGTSDGDLRAFEAWRKASEDLGSAEFRRWLSAGRPARADRLRATLAQHAYVDFPLVNGWARRAEKEGLLRVEKAGREDIWHPVPGGPSE